MAVGDNNGDKMRRTLWRTRLRMQSVPGSTNKLAVNVTGLSHQEGCWEGNWEMYQPDCSQLDVNSLDGGKDSPVQAEKPM